MFVRLSMRLILGCGVLLLFGCSAGPHFIAKYEPWREYEEEACLVSGIVQASATIEKKSALGGASVCGAEQPFSVSASGEGRVRFKPSAILRCPMIPQVERWISNVVEPAASNYFGSSLTEVNIGGSYACRPVNRQFGGNLSEHGYANALDVAGFTLADGRKVMIKNGWNGSEQERLFLRAVHNGACQEFTTVLGPDYNYIHSDHFHVDLARRGEDGLVRVCR